MGLVLYLGTMICQGLEVTMTRIPWDFPNLGTNFQKYPRLGRNPGIKDLETFDSRRVANFFS